MATSASSTAARRPATVISHTMRSTVSWSSFRNARAAVWARSTTASRRSVSSAGSAAVGVVLTSRSPARGHARPSEGREFVERAAHAVGQHVEIVDVAVGHQAEEQPTVVGEDGDPHAVVGSERHQRPDLPHPRTERVERQLGPGHVGDRDVEQPRGKERTRKGAVQRGRGERQEVDEGGRSECRVARLQTAGGAAGAGEAPGGVGLPHRQRHEQRRDPVAEPELVRWIAHVDGDHRAQPRLGRRVAAVLQQRPKAAGHGGEDDVVDGSSQGALDRLDRIEIDIDHGEAPVGADRRVDARLRRGDELVAHEELGGRLGRLRHPERVQRGVDAGDRQPVPAAVLVVVVRGWGSSASGSSSAGPGSGSVSSRTCATPMEPTPSTMQWWVLEAIAQRPSSRPSTRTISHSGAERSRRCEKNSPAQRSSSARSPGGGRTARRQWRSIAKRSSSTHAGQLTPPVDVSERRWR